MAWLMDRSRKKNVIIGVLAILILSIVLCIVGLKIVQYERNQNNEINDLQNRVMMLDKKINNNDGMTWRSGGGYNYFAIGNSITVHPIVDYWWAEDGMAASSPEKDYFHIVSSDLKEIYGEDVVAYAYNLAAWETQAHDRAETYGLLDEYLSPEIDLITVQLSENCSDLNTFLYDFTALLEHIKDECGEDVQIVVIDDFWDIDKGKMKKTVCEEMNIDFVDLSDIRNDEIYMAGMGTVVEGDDGIEHVIEHDGVARHPGDDGMGMIAERVLELVKNP
jgi:hypothetical protein